MRWSFRKSRDTGSFEKELAALATKISKLQQKQAGWNTTLRRCQALFTIYSILVYTIYSAIVLVSRDRKTPRKLIHLLLIPVAIWAIRSIIVTVKNWSNSSYEDRLKALQLTQHELVEELKEKTNFYTTQALLSRFENSSSSIDVPKSTPEKRKQKSRAGTPSRTDQVATSTPKTDVGLQTPPLVAGETPALQTPQQQQQQQQFQPQFQQQLPPMQPYQPQWYDKLFDAIIGEDELSPKARYALICARCHAHNGLAAPGEKPEDVVYYCPYCQFKNGKEKAEPAQDAEVVLGTQKDDSTKSDSIEIEAAEPTLEQKDLE